MSEDYTDFVCGMNLSDFSDRRSASFQGENFYFCSIVCKTRFEKTPERFIGKPLIEIRGLLKVFKLGEVDVQVLRSIDLRIWDGDFVVIVGASGSGKSTVLNMIGLLDRPTSGKVFLKGRDVSAANDDERAGFRAKTFGFIFQQYNLVPWLTAYENVTLPLLFQEKSFNPSGIAMNFQEIGLKERMHHRPTELSGGEQQRVALLRALSNNPEVILGDEPTGNLDSATGKKILEFLVNLNKKYKKTLVIVTHDADIADMADQVIAIKDGKVVGNHRTHKKMYTE